MDTKERYYLHCTDQLTEPQGAKVRQILLKGPPIGDYIRFIALCNNVVMDGVFDVEELERIVTALKIGQDKTPESPFIDRLISCGLLLADHAEAAKSVIASDNPGRESAIRWLRELAQEYHAANAKANTVLKTSQQWLDETPGLMILDPDGWDRSSEGFKSWNEPITRKEFERRCDRSTISQA